RDGLQLVRQHVRAAKRGAYVRQQFRLGGRQRRSERSSRRSSRRSTRRLTPLATTAAVATVVAVRATGAPITARRILLRAIPTSGPFLDDGDVVVFLGFDRREDGLDRDPSTRDELATRVTNRGSERCRPRVLPHEDGGRTSGFDRRG